MRLFYTDQFELPLPEEHKFPMSKYRLLRERISQAAWAASCELIVPRAATIEQLSLVHSTEYLRAVFAGTLTAKEVRRIGFPWSMALVERSLRSVGATIEASQAALEEGISASLAGGTHHAFRDYGEGFCVFNDVAVAARLLQANDELGVRSILIVDCDVHQGNGTAEIFAGDDAVFTFSMHGKRNYPLKKANSDLDLAFDSGTSDEEYLQALKSNLPLLFEKPIDFVFYVSGADAFELDRFGRLALTKQGLRQRDEFVIQQCRRLRIPLAIVMAGGYADNVDDIVDIHATTIEIAVRSSSAPLHDDELAR